MEVDYDAQFELCCSNGDINEAMEIHRKVDVIPITSSFIFACENGHIEICEWLYQTYPIAITYEGYYAFVQACKNGHMNVAQWLYQKHKPNQRQIELAFTLATSYGHIDICQWLYRPELLLSDSFKNFSPHEPEIMRWLVDVSSNMSYDKTLMNKAFYSGCKKGNLNLCQWLYDFTGIIDPYFILHNKEHNHAFVEACYGGHYNLCCWLIKAMPIKSCFLSYGLAFAVKYIEIVKLIVEYDIFDIGVFITHNPFYNACYDGNMEVIHYLHKYNIYNIPGEALYYASKGGHIHVCTWLLDTFPDICQTTSAITFYDACKYGHIEICKLLYDRCKSIYNFKNLNIIFRNACKSGNLELCQWLITIDHTLMLTTSDVSSFYFHADDDKVLKILKWLIDHERIGRSMLAPSVYMNNRLFIAPPIFYNLCICGYVKSAGWFYYQNISFSTVVDEYLFSIICGKNDLEMAKYLYFIRPNIKMDRGFLIACEKKQYLVLRWLTRINPKYKYKIMDMQIVPYV